MKHPKGYIHAMYGATESLLWPVDRVITHIDWINHTNITFIDKPRLVQDLALSPDQFLDMCILAGSALSRTFPPFANDFSIKTILDLLRQYKSGIAACQAWRQDNQVKASAYLDAFMRARLAVKYSIVLTTEGICMSLPMIVQPSPPVSLADIPADFDEIFSLRLPDELYYHICRGLISPQVIGWLSSGLIVESHPLADCPDYRRFIKDVITEGHTAPRCTTLALLVDALHPQWKQRRVVSGLGKMLLTPVRALLLRAAFRPHSRLPCSLYRPHDAIPRRQMRIMAGPICTSRERAQAAECECSGGHG